MGERVDTGGLASVLRVLDARGGVVDGAGEQASMFEADDAPLPLPAKGKSGPQGGRPLGAVNKSTDAWARYLLGQHRSPLSVLANIMSQPLDQLHAQLQAMADKHATLVVGETGQERVVGAIRVDPLQVLKLQKDAAVALAPYLHKQQPKAVEVSERPRGVMFIGELATEDAETVGEDGELHLALPPVELQRVSAPSRTSSDSAASDDEGNKSDNNPLAYNGD